MKILITGTSGYIGSLCFIHLKKNKNLTVFGLDKKKPNIALSKNKKNIFLCNLLNKKKLNFIIDLIKPNIIVHLAGLSTVNQNIKKKEYQTNNVEAMKYLIEVMRLNKIENFIFSSTASVYKNKNKLKFSENSDVAPLSYYAKSKLDSEKIIKKNKLNYIIFRFFNVCSSYSNPRWGEMHSPETHLFPTLIYKLIKEKTFYINGNNYPTKDGTCIRDYVHIVDILNAIEKSINLLKKKKVRKIINIGTSKGFSILEIINYIKINYKFKLKFKFKEKRSGDAIISVCKNKKAQNILGWKPIRSNLRSIIKDEISWIRKMDKLKIKRFF